MNKYIFLLLLIINHCSAMETTDPNIEKAVIQTGSPISALDFTMSNTHICIGLSNGTIKIKPINSIFSTFSHLLSPSTHITTNPALDLLRCNPKNHSEITTYHHWNVIQQYDIEKKQKISKHESKHGLFSSLEYSPDGNIIATAVSNLLQLHDLRQKKVAQELQYIKNHELNDLAFDNTGNNIVIGTSRGHTKIIDLRETYPFRNPPVVKNNGCVASVDWDNQNKLITCNDLEHGKVGWYDITQTDSDNCAGVEIEDIYSINLTFNTDSTLLATTKITENLRGNFEHRIRVYDPEKLNLRYEFTEHRDWIMDLRFDKTGTILASGGMDKKVILRSLAKKVESKRKK